jgi:hypothetical protein
MSHRLCVMWGCDDEVTMMVPMVVCKVSTGERKCNKVAYDEATYLWSLLGYDPCETLTDRKSQPGNSVLVPEDIDDDDSSEELANAACNTLLSIVRLGRGVCGCNSSTTQL